MEASLEQRQEFLAGRRQSFLHGFVDTIFVPEQFFVLARIAVLGFGAGTCHVRPSSNTVGVGENSKPSPACKSA